MGQGHRLDGAGGSPARNRRRRHQLQAGRAQAEILNGTGVRQPAQPANGAQVFRHSQRLVVLFILCCNQSARAATRGPPKGSSLSGASRSGAVVNSGCGRSPAAPATGHQGLASETFACTGKVFFSTCPSEVKVVSHASARAAR